METFGIIGHLFIPSSGHTTEFPRFRIRYYEETQGYQIASFSGWMFFVLLNAFYGGAMTMFFTSGGQQYYKTIAAVKLRQDFDYFWH